MAEFDLFFFYLETEFTRLAAPYSWTELAGLAFLLLTILETGWDVITRHRTHWKETLINAFIFAGNILLDILGLGLLFLAGLFFVEPFAFLDLKETSADSWWYWPALILLADLTYYWMHRTEHEIRLLWAVHVVHHSSEEYNLTTAYRLSWFEGLFEWIFLVPMILLGFGTVEVLLAFIIVVQYQTWIHTEKIKRLGWLDHVFNTPSNHRVHHGSNPKYLDKNYGGILILWDRLFGTYEREQEVVRFGITETLTTSNPLKILTHEFVSILSDLKERKGIGARLRAVFGPPGG